MAITRKQFLSGLAGGTVTLLVQGCGGGGSSSSSTAGAGMGGGYNGMTNALSACAFVMRSSRRSRPHDTAASLSLARVRPTLKMLR